LPEGKQAISQTKDIRAAVERELGYDPLIDDSDISVKNLNGDVALGRVASQISVVASALPSFTAAWSAAWSRSFWSAYFSAKSAIAWSNLLEPSR
jgi:hypothetical protein